MSAAKHTRRLVALARTDRTFERWHNENGRAMWRGKCLICNGFLTFTEHERTVDRQATIEHILARCNGGSPDDPDNLAIVHPSCNSEKGRRTDPLGPGDPKHDAVIERMRERRLRRLRDATIR